MQHIWLQNKQKPMKLAQVVELRRLTPKTQDINNIIPKGVIKLPCLNLKYYKFELYYVALGFCCVLQCFKSDGTLDHADCMGQYLNITLAIHMQRSWIKSLYWTILHGMCWLPNPLDYIICFRIIVFYAYVHTSEYY